MPTVTTLLRRGLLKDIPERVPSLEALRRTQRSPEFEKLCMNRKIIGAMRYGLLGAEDKPKYDRAADMIHRLKEYQKDGNKEHLVDVANLAELEFVEGDGVFEAKESDHHTEER
jgi:hypothetical protein